MSKSKNKANVRLADSVELESIELIDCVFNVDKEHSDKSGKLSISLSMQIEPIEDDDFLNKLLGTLSLELNGETEEEDEIFSMKINFLSEYAIKKKYQWEQEEINHFSKTSMVMHMWPYTREFVSVLVEKSPLQKFTLPILPLNDLQASK